jgi:hypothetical protein
MSRTLTPKNEMPQHTERPPRDRVEGELATTTSAQVDPISGTSSKVQKGDSQASVSAQAIQEERQKEPLEELNHIPLKSELSFIASLQRDRLGDEQPSAGFGGPNLPFAE